MTSQNQLHSVQTASARLGISRAKTWLLIKEGDLRVVKIGRRTLVSEAEIDRFVASLVDRGPVVAGAGLERRSAVRAA